MGCDGLFGSNRPDSFARLGFDANLLRVDVKQLGQLLLYFYFDIGKFRALRKDNAIDIGDDEASLPHTLVGEVQHLAGVSIMVGGLGIWEHLADIAQRRRAQDRIGDSMQEDVRIAVADRMPIVRNIDPAQPQRAPRIEPVCIVSDSNALQTYFKASGWFIVRIGIIANRGAANNANRGPGKAFVFFKLHSLHAIKTRSVSEGWRLRSIPRLRFGFP